MNPTNLVTNYSVGQRIILTKDNWLTIRHSNRSIHAYPDDNYVNIVYQLMTNSVAGTVTKRFTPGYEFNVTFDNGQVLQMKDHWVTPMPEYDPVDFL